MLAIPLLLWVHEARASLAKPGCQERCGNITVPYPYGMGTGCFLNTSFAVSCNESSPHISPLRFVNNDQFPISEISMDSIRIVGMVPFTCLNYTATTKASAKRFQLDPHFRYSHTKNVYIAVGCNISASFQTVSPSHFRKARCASRCIATPTSGFFACNGSNGCCQSSIPVETNAYKAVISNHGLEAACSHAFIAEKNYTLEKYLYGYTESSYQFPVVLNWVITLTSCHRTQLRGSCLCGKNSQCIDSAKGLGHNCRCKNGYGGNPYLRTGCQGLTGSMFSGSSKIDINECLIPGNYPCREDQLCVNTPGSYMCTSSRRHILIVSVIIVSVIGIFGFGAIGHYAYKEIGRRKENKIKQEFFKRNGGYLLKQHISANKSHVMRLKVYAAEEIEKATDSFSQSRLLGKGGQGTVYKGFLTDGTIVAIKRSNVVDEDQVERFVNEVFILSQINHRNIVKLLGCCLESEVPLLVYEYLSNGTLSQHLHDGAEVSKFSWKDRIRVARDVAGALAYLHSYASPAIFHRDVKPHNILLDENYRAVVSDFGLSRSISLSRTHLTTKIEGTFGYLDPEYFRSGQLTEKSDVYAFGVVLMELLTRRKVVSSTNCGEGLVSHFQFLVKQNRVLEILDQQVLDEALMDDIFLVTMLVKTCMKKNVKERQNMKEVVMGLDKLKVVQLDLPSNGL
ncbi:unnamed protein product [Lactuca saligna]|uniref:Protein kinase domain-containing protein n=1 Tax=Lactuca saligna TaxID=75948 RepID=A0AA35ZJX2_LACSI|nr:unnamed protein product [Lactuca saligna]